MSVQFTVVIPTYNGGHRLEKVLEKLRSQHHTEAISWEILIVDNNSHDNTKSIIEAIQTHWTEAIPLRYSFEPKQGLAFARQRGVEDACGDYVGFLDDDTLPALDWVSAAYYFGQDHPKAGAFGGQIHGEFEVDPPENFERIQSFLAIKKRGSKPHLYEPDKLVLPPGAGLVVRRNAWLESVPQQLVRTGRGGNDFEVSLHLHRAQWEIWYNPAMTIYHQISRQRLERDYLIRLIRTAGLCVCQLRLVGAKTWQKPIIMGRILLGNARRAALHVMKYRGKVRTDLIAACEMTFFVSCMISPFYCVTTSLQKNLGTLFKAS